ncbi:MAG: LLM class flavin-dependent oxidoreductase [Actinomycetota bacterium]|nr:LLM class flavin-dependent oxidoreductase [Actinomycetota bacterium]
MSDLVRHGLFFPPFGELSDPATVLRIGEAAEGRGWDGVFLWDHMIRPPGDPQEIADPWILLAAVAASTTTIRLGTMVTPLARRRPQKLARETVTLDRLSRGRLVLGIGLGTDSGGEFGRFAECTEEPARAAMLDEALELLFALWSGEEVHHEGPHFRAEGVRFLPTPFQRPRIPVWGAAVGDRPRPGPLHRAARLDGIFPVHATIEEFRAIVEEVRSLRGSLDGFDVAAEVEPDAEGASLDEYEEAGATWIMHSFPVDATAEDVANIAERGPLASDGVPRS